MWRIAIITLAAFLLLLVIVWPGRISTVSAWKYEDYGGFESYGERLEFRRLLKKHGLHQQVSIVYEWPKNPYFIDAEGRRCAFK